MALLDGLGRSLKALDCFVLGQADYIFGGLNALQGLDQGLTADVINGYRRLRGCTGPDIEPPPPSYLGGQCPGALYRGTGDVFQNGVLQGNPSSTSNTFLEGPLVFNGVVDDGLNISYPVTDVNGAVSRLTMGGANFRPNTDGWEVRNIEFVITSGVECSEPDPPPQLPPPTDITIDVDVEYTDEGDNIVNITVPVVFKPFNLNFNGDVSFPIEFSLGGIDFNGDVSFFPDFKFSVGGPKFPKGFNGEEGEPDPDNVRPPAAPQAIIVGATVVATSVSDNAATSIEFGGGPDIFAPRLGSVKFAYSLGAATFWSSDIDVKGRQVFVPCPFSQGADAVEASPVPGVALRVTPVFGFPLATIGDIKVVLDDL